MIGEFKIEKSKTLTPEQEELKNRINDRMRDVGPEEYDKFIMERGRGEKAKNSAGDLSDLLDKEKDYEILELGPGTGIYTQELDKIPNIKLNSLDFRKDLIDYGIAKGRIRSDRASVGDFEQMPFDEKSFDVLTGMAVVNQRRNVEEFFSEIKRVLKDEGLVFFPWIKKKGASFERETKLLKEHGFEIISTKGSYILARKESGAKTNN
jgi:ubiquinone/menaquinone biosynthesis C-methylase UbiE